MAILFEVVEEGFSYSHGAPLGSLELRRSHPDFICTCEQSWWKVRVLQ